MKIRFVNFDVQFKGTGHDMICCAGLCSMQGTVVQRGVMGSGHAVLCVNFIIYIYMCVCVCVCVRTLLHSYTTGGTESSFL